MSRTYGHMEWSDHEGGALRRGASSRRGAFRPEIYDLEKDPLEKSPLPSDSAATLRLQDLAARYWATYARSAAVEAAPPKMDDATRERLRALRLQRVARRPARMQEWPAAIAASSRAVP